MKTTATNRKVRELLTSLREGKLQPRPEFQRRLVWSNKDKSAFLDTVLKNYPFPEIYVAAGDVNVETGEAKEMLVDGQQRITTLYQYFTGSPDLKLAKNIPSYTGLENKQKEAFLQYDVVVRDLGKVPMEEIREVFRRINATSYALNAMEIHNARFEGEFKAFAEQIAQHEFFERHRVFSASEVKRMQDTRFILVLASMLLSTYFNRDDEIEEFLNQYNDEFPQKESLTNELYSVFSFIDDLTLPRESRAWKKVDLFTLMVEVHRALFKDKLSLDVRSVRSALLKFYQEVDSYSEGVATTDENVSKYHKAALQATSDRGSRIARGDAIRAVLKNSLAGEQLGIEGEI